MLQQMETGKDAVKMTPGPRLRAAMILAVVADIVQIFLIPSFVEGAVFPPDDILDLLIGGVLTWLLGWHWEFLPSFLGKLAPGVDYVPLWTLAVANVYRKAKAQTVAPEGAAQEQPRA